MFWLALGIILVVIIINGHHPLKDCVFVVMAIILGATVFASGFIDSIFIQPNEVSDFDVCDKVEEYEIKDFSIISSTSSIYSFIYCDSNKKENIEADKEKMIVVKNVNCKGQYKLTIKEKKIFELLSFTTKTYKQYVFS